MNIKDKISAANVEALKRMNAVNPVLIDIQLAKDVIPRINKKTILHAGPPIKWERMCNPMKGAIAGILAALSYVLALQIKRIREKSGSDDIPELSDLEIPTTRDLLKESKQGPKHHH